MPRPMVLWFLLLQGTAPAPASDPGMAWRPEYEAARTEAREKHRLVLLHFYMAGRPLCQAMEEETFASAEVVRLVADHFVPVRVDVEKRPELFESTIGGRGGLATCLLDAEGDVMSALSGFAGPDAFRRFLERGEAGAGAIRSARAALSASPEDPERLEALAEAYRSVDSLRRAEACFRKAIDELQGKPALDPAATRAAAISHERLARLRIMRGKNLEAREHLAAARRLDPDARWIARDRMLLTEGLTLALERKHAESSRVLEDALRRFPSSEEADHLMYALGYVRHLDGQNDRALEVLEAALRRFPQSTWIPAVREQIDHIRNPQPDHTH